MIDTSSKEIITNPKVDTSKEFEMIDTSSKKENYGSVKRSQV